MRSVTTLPVRKQVSPIVLRLSLPGSGLRRCAPALLRPPAASWNIQSHCPLYLNAAIRCQFSVINLASNLFMKYQYMYWYNRIICRLASERISGKSRVFTSWPRLNHKVAVTIWYVLITNIIYSVCTNRFNTLQTDERLGKTVPNITRLTT